MGRQARPRLPLGVEIAEALAQALQFNDPRTVAHRYGLDVLAEWYQDTHSWPELCDFMASQIRDEVRVPGAAYEIAARLDFAAYVTTNYDTVLERAVGPLAQVIVSPFGEAPINGRKPIYKTHGSIGQYSKQTFIVTAEQYDRVLYNTGSPLETKLKQWFLAAHVIFVGFSLYAAEFRRLYSLARYEALTRDGDVPRHIAVYPNSQNQERDFWHRRGISVIDGDADEFFRVLDSYLAPEKALTELSHEYRSVTGVDPDPSELRRETLRGGRDERNALAYMLTREKIKRGLL
jgi:hypothetical protein